MNSVHIVGVLNVTPDSYHDGGQFVSVDKAVERAGQMIAEGVDIIEVGGESTGPNSPDISLEEEMHRTIPVINEIRKRYVKTQLSVDTYKAPVAEAAIQAGAVMINDVTAGRSDPEMFSVVKKMNTRLVLMYAKDPTPRTTIADTRYNDVIKTIAEFLRERKDAAIAAGVKDDSIILDPGLGHFVSSDPNYSFEIIARLREFQQLGSPLFISPSRKSFLAGTEKLKTVDRLPGTIAASAIAVLHGASFIRTHDVLPVRRACDIAASAMERRS